MATQQKKKLTLKSKRIFSFKGSGQNKGFSTDPTIPPTTTMIFYNK